MMRRERAVSRWLRGLSAPLRTTVENSDFITRNWRSLVAHMLWEHGVVGSNPTFRIRLRN